MTYLSQLSVVSPDPCRQLYLPAVCCAGFPGWTYPRASGRPVSVGRHRHRFCSASLPCPLSLLVKSSTRSICELLSFAYHPWSDVAP